MKLREILQPFWYQPEFQDDSDKVEFRLRPLTEADMVEIDALAEGRSGSVRAHYEAGCMAILEVRGAYEANGEPAKWPACRSRMPRVLVSMAGYRAIVAQMGGDWDERVRRIDGHIRGVDVDEEPEDPHEDPVKN